MNRNFPIKPVAAILAAILVGVLVGRFTSSRGAPDNLPTTGEASVATAEPEIWTCSMHPQIQQPGAGDCPICGMDLIPLQADDGNDSNPRVMTMSESAKALAEIQTTAVTRGFPEAEVRLSGRLGVDETRVRSLTARFPARIEKLYVNYTGIPVKAGEHLGLIYSPDLLSAQQELLTAHRTNPASSFTRAAREKLRLWDLEASQIEALIESGQATDSFELRAPVGGIVMAKNVNEGDYVTTGQPLFKIADLDKLWLLLDAYESDLPWLRYGQEVSFTVEAFPGESFSGTIAFIEPQLNPETRTVRVRVNVPNPGQRLKPGMFARGTVYAKLATDGQLYAPDLSGKWISPMHPEIVKDGPGTCDVCGMDLVPAESLGYVSGGATEAPLLVPASAVLRTGRRAVVYVELAGRERPSYEGREITLGPRAGDVFIVRDGLAENDRVVTNGAFKIDSALQIQAKPSMMSLPTEQREAGPDPDALPAELATRILPDYFALQQALAGDKLDAARVALTEIMDKTGHSGDIAEHVHLMLAAETLDGIRRPHFEILSNALISAIRSNPEAFSDTIFLMHCPMVYDDRDDAGADWLQADDTLLNPYFGAMMLHCGEVKEQLKQAAP